MLNKYTTYEINKLFKCIHFRHENATKLVSGSETKKNFFEKFECCTDYCIATS